MGTVGELLRVTTTGAGCVASLRVFLSKAGVSGVTSEVVDFENGVDFSAVGAITFHPTLKLAGVWDVYATVYDKMGRMQSTGLVRPITIAP